MESCNNRHIKDQIKEPSDATSSSASGKEPFDATSTNITTNAQSSPLGAEIKIRPWNGAADLKLFEAWHRERGAVKFQPVLKTMAVALEPFYDKVHDTSGKDPCGDPIAFAGHPGEAVGQQGFAPVAFAGLVQTDAPYALIDSVCVRPGIAAETKEQALGLLYLNLGGLAYKLGYKKLLFTTRFQRLKNHGIMFNAQSLSAETFSVNLEEEAPKYGF